MKDLKEQLHTAQGRYDIISLTALVVFGATCGALFGWWLWGLGLQ